MIFQDPMTFLNPLFTAGEQVSEAIRRHQGLDRTRPATKSSGSSAKSASPVPRCATSAYPHQLSGGLRQRVMIAMALSSQSGTADRRRADNRARRHDPGPDLALLRDLQHDYGMSILLITHDLGVVAEMCDRVAVMYAGRIVEQAPIDVLFDHPEHPYSLGLMNAIPRPICPIFRRKPIEGSPPDMLHPPLGAVSSALSLSGADLRRRRSPHAEVAPGHASACHFAGEKIVSVHRLDADAMWNAQMMERENDRPPLLEVRDLVKHFPIAARYGRLLRRAAARAVRAVDGVSFSVAKGPDPGAGW